MFGIILGIVAVENVCGPTTEGINIQINKYSGICMVYSEESSLDH